MTGLAFFLMVGIWFFIAKLITTYLVGFLKKRIKGNWVQFAVFPLVFVIPLVDEIVATPQVNKICREGAVLKIDAEKANNKMIKIVVNPSWEEIGGTIVPIKYSHFSYRVIDTNEEVASFNIYHVSGGFLSRLINFNSMHSPWIIDTSGCHPKGYGSIQKKYNFSIVN